MDRRSFLKTGMQTTVACGIATGATASAAAPETSTRNGTHQESSLLRDYTAEDHRRRLQNIAKCTTEIQSCLREHFVSDYLPGQCCYNLGEYPSTKPWNPDEYDEQELDRLRDEGIQLIQVFDDWNDSLRLFGGDKYSAVNPSGYQRFIEMVHKRGMKVLTYTSTCFIQQTDPDFRPEWRREGDILKVGYWNMARCSPASPGWRAFVLNKISQVIEEYGSDGIYVDGGYLSNQHLIKKDMPLAKDEIVAFEETPNHDGAFADLLALIYGHVKQRGGILKLHVNGAEKPESGNLTTYDYLWVGEGVKSADSMREKVKNYAPYVVPCIDFEYTGIDRLDEPYLHSIPYMQFPVTMGGRTFTGERGFVPGIEYRDDFWLKRCKKAWKLYQEDPSQVHAYSVWDPLPGNAQTRPLHSQWLKRYQRLVEEGTRVWIDIKKSSLFASELPSDVVATAYVNRDLHLVLANYGASAVDVPTSANYVDTNSNSPRPANSWNIPARSLVILKRV